MASFQKTGAAAAEVHSERATAAAVVADAVALALEAAAAEAAEAVQVTADAVTEAAVRAADAAERAKGARAFAAEAAAQSVANVAVRAATQVREHAAQAADQVHRAALLAADELARSIASGTALDTARMAILLQNTVRAAADATARDTTQAANTVRNAGVAAADAVVQTVNAAEQVFESEVAAAAVAQRDLATAAAVDLAKETGARAAGVAIAAREAASALLIVTPNARAVTPRVASDTVEPATPALKPPAPFPARTIPRNAIDEIVETFTNDPRESRDRLQFLVDAVTGYAIITLDPDGVIESWNTGAQRLKGYTAEEALGQHFSIFYTAEDRDIGLPQRVLDRARAEGSHEETGWRVRGDGTRFWGDITISAMQDEDGNLTGFVKVTRDLTEQHRLEIAQNSFYNAFVHDFRMPVTAIKGFAELIRGADPEDQKYLVTRVDSNADRMLAMVEELVEYARLRSGLIPLSLRTVDMVTVARSAVANLASIAETSRVQVTASGSVKVLADPAALERAIANLVTNALKYSPAGSDIELICDRVEDMGVLRIVDQGRGIDERDLGSIFLEFERGRLAQNDSGTGLGLASVQHLIGVQHGTVDITSQVEIGTTVTIQLPLAP